MNRLVMTIAAGLLCAGSAGAGGSLTVDMNAVSDAGTSQQLGSIRAEDTEYGLLLTPHLRGLAPGIHGFHVHQNPDCGPATKDGNVVPGGAAGGHYDPESTGRHEGPYGGGHLGDLPALYVATDGTAMTPVLAPRLKVSDIKGRALMIHAGGDNYSDQPAALGGGGARMACGVVAKDM